MRLFGSCLIQTKFFCKVYDILQKHFDHGREKVALVRNLKVFLRGRNVSIFSNASQFLHSGASLAVGALDPA